MLNAKHIAASGLVSDSPAVRASLTRTTPYGDEFYLFKQCDDGLLAPRGLCTSEVDLRSKGSPAKLGVLNFEPRNDAQRRVLTQGDQLLADGRSFIIEAGTGVGKTVLSLVLAYRLGVTTVVVVDQENIMNQWIDRIREFLGLPDEMIGRIQGDTCRYKGCPITVAMVHSVCKDGRYPEAMYSYFGLAFFDECFHPSHDLLTPGGWRPVAAIQKGDQVMSYCPESGKMEFQEVFATTSREFSGDLVHVQARGTDLLVTPNHEHTIRYQKTGELKRVKLGGQSFQSRIECAVSGNLVSGDGLTPRERLRVAFEADGHLLRHRTRTKDFSYRFAFRRPRKIHRVREILEDNGIEYRESVNARGDTNITFNLPELMVKDFDWFDPYQSQERNEQFIQELALWDGWKDLNGYCWQGEQDKAELIYLIGKLSGYDGSVKKYPIPSGDVFRVRLYKKEWVAPKSWKRTKILYSGPVHCVSVPSQNLLTRREGKLSITGNCHVMGAETFNNACFLINSHWRVGLSATPDRKDGKDELFKTHIGPVMIRESKTPLIPKVILSASGWNCPTRKVQDPTGQWILKKIPHTPAKCAHVIKSLTNCKIRTNLIANFTTQAYKKGRNIVIFSDLKDAYLPKLEAALIEHGVSPEDIGFYVGGMKEKDLKVASRKSVVLTTFKMTAKAVDCPWWDTAVIATPKSDVRQALGRVLREYPGKVDASRVGQGVIPIIFDVADLDSPIFKNYYKARLRYYREIGAPFGGDTRLLNLR